MITTLQLTGIHHVSALSAHIERTHNFYTRVLGLRPVIKTVNQDDPSMYHLFYGDGVGSPGSDITVFDMPYAAAERRGNNSISLTTFRVDGETALAYWAARLDEHGIGHSDIIMRDGLRVLDFDDPEGTQLSLIDDGAAGRALLYLGLRARAERRAVRSGHRRPGLRRRWPAGWGALSLPPFLEPRRAEIEAKLKSID